MVDRLLGDDCIHRAVGEPVVFGMLGTPGYVLYRIGRERRKMLIGHDLGCR
jgi:hypothetical protein